MVPVAERSSLLFGDRAWFYDTRSPARRMGVSVHPDQGVFVISFWQGDSCSGTFRMPLADADAVITVLARGMASAVPPATLEPSPPTPPDGEPALRLVD